MIVKSFPVGMLQCNCTIVACPKTKQAMVVDPGGEADRILETLRGLGLTVTVVVHTHAHFDHAAGTQAIKDATGAPAWLHPGDRFLIDGFAEQGKMVGLPLDLGPGPEIDGELEHHQEVRFGEACSLVLHTPGHTPGSVCFSLRTPDGPLLLSGDTLFRMGIGRTDFPGGDYDLIQTSLRDQLLALEDTTRVIPGHGPETTIGQERRENPFLR